MKKVLFSTVAIVILSSSVAFAASPGFNDLMNRRGTALGQFRQVSEVLDRMQKDLENLNKAVPNVVNDKNQAKQQAIQLTRDASNAARAEGQMLFDKANSVNPMKRGPMIAEATQLTALSAALAVEAKSLEQQK